MKKLIALLATVKHHTTALCSKHKKSTIRSYTTKSLVAPVAKDLLKSIFIHFLLLLGEVIQWFGVKLHQYPNDAWLYISIPGHLSNAVDILWQCLEAVGIRMGVQWASTHGRLSESRNHRVSGDKVLPSLVLDGMALIQMNPVCNLRVLLDS